MILVKSAPCKKHTNYLKLTSKALVFYYAHLFQQIDTNVSFESELATKILIGVQDKPFFCEKTNNFRTLMHAVCYEL